MPFLKIRERLARERKERYGAIADCLSLTNEIASKSLRKHERDEAKPDGLT